MEAKPRKTEVVVEAMFGPHQETVAQIKQSYEEATKTMFDDLSADDLSAFVDIQKENGDAYADTEALVPKLREKLTDIMMKMHLSFFEGNDIENKLLALEVLKEKFAGQEGKQWNVNEMTPEELTRPLRIQLMDSSIRYMERKIETQQKKLETALEKSKANRERVQNIQNERVKLNAIMEQQLAEFKEIKPQILDLQKSLIDSISQPDC